MPRPAARASPGALENLAPELLIPILISLPDLKSLDNLLQASPAAFRLFNLRGVEIFEAILSSDVTAHTYTVPSLASLFSCGQRLSHFTSKI